MEIILCERRSTFGLDKAVQARSRGTTWPQTVIGNPGKAEDYGCGCLYSTVGIEYSTVSFRLHSLFLSPDHRVKTRLFLLHTCSISCSPGWHL